MRLTPRQAARLLAAADDRPCMKLYKRGVVIFSLVFRAERTIELMIQHDTTINDETLVPPNELKHQADLI